MNEINKPQLGSVFLVIRRGALIGTTTDLDDAMEQAEEAAGLVAQVPVVVDYRGRYPLVNVDGRCEHGVGWDIMSPQHHQWYHVEHEDR